MSTCIVHKLLFYLHVRLLSVWHLWPWCKTNIIPYQRHWMNWVCALTFTIMWWMHCAVHQFSGLLLTNCKNVTDSSKENFNRDMRSHHLPVVKWGHQIGRYVISLLVAATVVACIFVVLLKSSFNCSNVMKQRREKGAVNLHHLSYLSIQLCQKQRWAGQFWVWSFCKSVLETAPAHSCNTQVTLCFSKIMN